MVNKISFTLLALLLSFCLALVGCSTSGGKNAQGVENGEGIEQEQGETGQEEISIRLGHHHAVDGSVDKLANKISELAAEKSGGAMKIEVFPGGQLGQEQEAIDGINMGTLEMSIVSPGLMDQYDPIFGIETLPFIFEDWDHADSALNGEVGQVLRDRLLEESDIHIMGFMHLGFRHMITQSKPIESLEDIQGMKMRSPEAWVWVRMFELLGANPTPVTWGEAYTALQTGVVEGMESPASNILDMKFNEVTDYLILTKPGTNIITQKMLRERLAFTVFTQEDEPVLIVCGIEESLVKEESHIEDIRTYVEFKESPISSLVNVLKEKGLDNAVVALENKYLTVHFATEFWKAMPGVTIVDAEPLFDRLRAIKNPKEIEYLRRAASITTKVMEEVFKEAKPGDTERDVATRMIQLLFERGADTHEFIVIGTGKRSSIIHPLAEDIPLRSGDVLKVDFGGKFNGYYSDVARTVLTGKPTARQTYVLTSLAEIHRQLIQHAKVGVKFSNLYHLCKELFRERKLAFSMPHIGHSMGLGLHEEPVISPLNDDVLEENMVLNIEPICIDMESGAGYHLEDLVLITKDGPEVLTGSSLDEHPIVIE